MSKLLEFFEENIVNTVSKFLYTFILINFLEEGYEILNYVNYSL